MGVVLKVKSALRVTLLRKRQVRKRRRPRLSRLRRKKRNPVRPLRQRGQQATQQATHQGTHLMQTQREVWRMFSTAMHLNKQKLKKKELSHTECQTFSTGGYPVRESIIHYT